MKNFIKIIIIFEIVTSFFPVYSMLSLKNCVANKKLLLHRNGEGFTLCPNDFVLPNKKSDENGASVDWESEQSTLALISSICSLPNESRREKNDYTLKKIRFAFGQGKSLFVNYHIEQTGRHSVAGDCRLTKTSQTYSIFDVVKSLFSPAYGRIYHYQRYCYDEEYYYDEEEERVKEKALIKERRVKEKALIKTINDGLHDRQEHFLNSFPDNIPKVIIIMILSYDLEYSRNQVNRKLAKDAEKKFDEEQ